MLLPLLLISLQMDDLDSIPFTELGTTSLRTPEWCRAFAISNTGLLVLDSGDAHVFDLANKQLLAKFPVPRTGALGRFNADGSEIARMYAKDGVWETVVHDPRTGKELYKVPGMFAGFTQSGHLVVARKLDEQRLDLLAPSTWRLSVYQNGQLKTSSEIHHRSMSLSASKSEISVLKVGGEVEVRDADTLKVKQAFQLNKTWKTEEWMTINAWLDRRTTRRFTEPSAPEAATTF